MVRKPVTFLNTEYKTQEEFGKFVKKIIYEDIGICYDIKNTYPEEYSILIKILERHPCYEIKSSNMCNLKIQENQYKNGYETWIIKDGGEIDISWKVAITGKHKPKKGELMSAMRVSVEDQTYNFRRNCDIYCCELCGSVKALQVDHNDEKNSAFDELAYNFVKENNDIKIPDNFGELNDGTNRRCFLEKDYVFRDNWVEYHRQHASLRMLCHKCNITRPKTKIKLVL